MQSSYKLTADQLAPLPFLARGLIALNPTGAPIYVRMGGTDFASATNADFIIPPATYLTMPIPEASNYTFKIGTTVLPSQLGTVPIVTLTDRDVEPAIASVQLPQVTFNTTVVSWSANIVGAGTSTIYTPPAGKNTAIYQMWGMLTCPAPAATPAIVATLETVTGATIINRWGAGGAVGVTIYLNIPPLLFAPQPLVIGVNEKLLIRNITGGETLQARLIASLATF